MKKYLCNNLLALDRLLNTLWGGSSKETVSSRLGRMQKRYGGTVPWFRPWPHVMAWALNNVDANHCEKSIETDEMDHIKNDSVIDGDL